MVQKHDVAKLPKWAQDHILKIASDNFALRSRVEQLEKAHAVLTDREWFTLNGPHETEPFHNLFWLSNAGARKACALAKGDVLLVGRKKCQ